MPFSAKAALVLTWISGPALIIGGAYALRPNWSSPLVWAAVGGVAYIPLMMLYAKLFPTPLHRS